MNVCEIVNIALGLEMAVNDNLLKVHDCGNGEGQSKADPQVIYIFYFLNRNKQ